MNPNKASDSDQGKLGALVWNRSKPQKCLVGNKRFGKGRRSRRRRLPGHSAKEYVAGPQLIPSKVLVAERIKGGIQGDIGISDRNN